MTATPHIAKCGNCLHFRNDPAYMEAAFKGLNAMSSAWGSVAADDGLCLLHDRHLSTHAFCDKFELAER
jgi:hypothetical protein